MCLEGVCSIDDYHTFVKKGMNDLLNNIPKNAQDGALSKDDVASALVAADAA